MKQPKFKFGDKICDKNCPSVPITIECIKNFIVYEYSEGNYSIMEYDAVLYIALKKMVTKYLWAIKADKNIWSNLSEFCETELEFRDRYDLGYDLEVKRLDFSATEFEVED